MAHIKLHTEILQRTKNFIFFADLTKKSIILIDLKSNDSNYLSFLLQSDFSKNSGANACI